MPLLSAIPSPNINQLRWTKTPENIAATPVNRSGRWRFGLYTAKAAPRLGSFNVGINANLLFFF